VSDGWWHLRREPPFSDKRCFFNNMLGAYVAMGLAWALLAYCVMYGAWQATQGRFLTP
jgi:hypothetical protein